MARGICTGQVEVNGGRFNSNAPFGGYKEPDNDREYDGEKHLKIETCGSKCDVSRAVATRCCHHVPWRRGTHAGVDQWLEP